MATETTRKDYGSTSSGVVTVIGKQSYTDDGSSTVTTYEVRHGNRTVDSGMGEKAAVAIAKALVGASPSGAPPEPEPEPEPEPVPARITRRV